MILLLSGVLSCPLIGFNPQLFVRFMIVFAPVGVKRTVLKVIATATDVTAPALIVNAFALLTYESARMPPELVARAVPPVTLTPRVSAVVSFTEMDCDPVFGPVVNVLGESVVVADTPCLFEREPEAVTTSGKPESVPLALTVKGVPAVTDPVGPVTVTVVEVVS